MPQAVAVKGVGPSAPPPIYSADAPRPGYVYNSPPSVEDTGAIEQLLGTLGLVETVILIIYSLGGHVSFTSFENDLLTTLAVFELVGCLVLLLTLLYMCNNTSKADRGQNLRTLSRDFLHNLMYPRSAPRSRKRRDFASFAWFGLLLAVIPVILLLSFFPVWDSRFEDPLHVRAIPSVLAVLAVLEIGVGCQRISFVGGGNYSSYGLTVLYANTKAIVLFVLLDSPQRLLLGEDGTATGTVLGLSLAFLEVLEIGSACFGARRYLNGTPDEDMPKLTAVLEEVICCCTD